MHPVELAVLIVTPVALPVIQLRTSGGSEEEHERTDHRDEGPGDVGYGRSPSCRMRGDQLVGLDEPQPLLNASPNLCQHIRTNCVTEIRHLVNA
jgi:hypothetical protein